MAELPKGVKVMEEFLEGCRLTAPAFLFDKEALAELGGGQREEF